MKKASKTITTACAVGLALISSNVLAEDEIIMTDAQGDVLINQGTDYNVANTGMEVQPGDQILVPDGGAAQLTYPNECVLNITGEFLLSVDEESPCVAGALVAAVGPPAATAAGIGTAGQIALGLGAAWVVYEVVDDDDDDNNTITP